MILKYVLCVGLVTMLAGCIAPEAPPVQRFNSTAAPKPALSTAGYEDAPVANRKMGMAGTDSVIRIAH